MKLKTSFSQHIPCLNSKNDLFYLFYYENLKMTQIFRLQLSEVYEISKKNFIYSFMKCLSIIHYLNYKITLKIIKFHGHISNIDKGKIKRKKIQSYMLQININA